MPPTALITIIIVSYKGISLLRNCLNSLILCSDPELPIIVHVVDNASDDGTPELLAMEYPEVVVHARKTNDGFAVANNLVLRDVSTPYVLVLNPDTEMREGVLNALVREMEQHPSVGIMGCRLVQQDGAFDHAAKRSFPTPNDAMRHFANFGRSTNRYLAPDVGEFSTGNVDSINGAFMLVRTSAMKQVGLFDERYWMYGEDLDWCRRFGESGWAVRYDGRVTVLHVKGGISGKNRSLRLNWHFHKSMFMFYRKFESGKNRSLDLLVYAGIAAKFIFAVVKSRLSRLRPVETSKKQRATNYGATRASTRRDDS